MGLPSLTTPISPSMRRSFRFRDITLFAVVAIALVVLAPQVVCASVAGSASVPEWQMPVPLEKLCAAKAALIPFPREVRWGEADWRPEARTTVICPSEQAVELRSAIAILHEAFAENGLMLAVSAQAKTTQTKSGEIRIAIAAGVAPGAEGYQLTVTSEGVLLQAVDAAGAFYGAHTLRQMMRPGQGGARVQTGVVRDWPAFRLRGFMHDVGRNYQTMESLKAQLNIFAAYKLNVFHWHLTDNPAWRIECHAYPQLNDPQFQTRDQGQIYTYAQIRELIAYARARHITVIPELDMPGHSAFFERAFGFKMGTHQGMDILEKLIEEFCREIPLVDRPYLHIGSDEVRIDEPEKFMTRMLGVVHRKGSQPMIWHPGLEGDERTIQQRWRDNAAPDGKSKGRAALQIDSTAGYINSYDPLLFVQRQYFHQPGQKPQGDDQSLGGILCAWPDVRVADKANIFRHNPVWSGLLAFTEAHWQGRATPATDWQSLLPSDGSLAGKSYQEFEGRVAAHRDRFFAHQPFPFVKSAGIPWRVIGPFSHQANLPGEFAFPPEATIQESYFVNNQTFTWREFRGGTVMLGSNRKDPSVFPQREIATAYALTYVHTDLAKTMHAWVGFETPERSTRKCGGIPAAGHWDAFGGNILVNDAPVPAPRWQQPGKNRYLKHTYDTPANEDPFTDEEFYWTREPAEIHLRAGWNKVLMRVPCGYNMQSWSYTFAPVKYDTINARWIEDESVTFSTAPENSH